MGFWSTLLSAADTVCNKVNEAADKHAAQQDRDRERMAKRAEFTRNLRGFEEKSGAELKEIHAKGDLNDQIAVYAEVKRRKTGENPLEKHIN